MIRLFLSSAEYVDEVARSCQLLQSAARFRHGIHREHGEPLGINYLKAMMLPFDYINGAVTTCRGSKNKMETVEELRFRQLRGSREESK